MKNILLAFLMLGATHLYAQPLKELGKYSYLCFAVNENKALNGTCFFYRSNKDLYLVTNYHVFYGADILNDQQLLHVDTLRVSYISSKTQKQKFFKIGNGNDTVQFFKHYDAPDLVAKKLTDVPDDFAVNCVNDVLEPAYFKEKPESIIMFGYPALYNKIQGSENADPQKCYVTANCGAERVNNFDAMLQFDKDARKIKRKISKKEFQIQVGVLPGFSGSPVYGRFFKNGEYQYRFIGVVFASDIVSNTSVAINGNTFTTYMKSFSLE